MTTKDVMRTHSPSSQMVDWVLVQLGELQLLLPQSDVFSVDYLNEKSALTYKKGLFYDSTKPTHAYIALSHDLRPLKVIPNDRFVVTLTKTTNHKVIGWFWEKVHVINNTSFDFFRLPAVVCDTCSPTTYAVEYKEQLAFYTESHLLLNYLVHKSKSKRVSDVQSQQPKAIKTDTSSGL